LLDRLTAMGIEPLGALECAPSLVEYRAWSPKGSKDKVNDAAADGLEAAILAAK
jgi:hypothetical protein